MTDKQKYKLGKAKELIEDSLDDCVNYKFISVWLSVAGDYCKEVSDCLYVLPNSENSKGTQAEIKRAKELNIPIFYSIDEIPL